MTVETSTWATKKGLAQMLKGGVIMDVVTPEHAKIAEEAGACAVMALERVPADIRAAGGVARTPACTAPRRLKSGAEARGNACGSNTGPAIVSTGKRPDGTRQRTAWPAGRLRESRN